ncbi:glycosyltransferase [candidate division KSB1 bacterium]|nr:glycosyltransferase [candidate division KSB1 bacterium]
MEALWEAQNSCLPGLQKDCKTEVTKPASSPVALLVFAGRLVREKGLFVLIHSFARVLRTVPSARLLIAGSGPLEPGLKILIR